MLAPRCGNNAAKATQIVGIRYWLGENPFWRLIIYIGLGRVTPNNEVCMQQRESNFLSYKYTIRRGFLGNV